MVGFKTRIEAVSPTSLPTKLRWLILTDNEIESLPDELGQCNALQKLMLGQPPARAAGKPCQLPSSGAVAHRRQPARGLPDWLLALPRLQLARLRRQPFSDRLERRLEQCASVADIPWAALKLGNYWGRGRPA